MFEVPALMRILRQQRGNALMLVLGAVAVVGVLTMEMYRRSENTLARARQNALKNSAEEIMSSLRGELQNPESCTILLAGLPFVPGGKTPVTLNWTYEAVNASGASAFPGPLSEGKLITTGVALGPITLDPETLGFRGQPAPPVDPATHADMTTQIRDAAGALQTFTRYPSRLHMYFYPAEQTAAGKAYIQAGVYFRPGGPAGAVDEGIPLMVWTDAAGKISACFGPNSAGAFCNLLAGYYATDPAGPVPLQLRCRQSFRTQQWINGAFVNIGSCRNGGYVNNPAQCAARFSNGVTVYDAIQLQQNWNGMPQGYLCQECQ
jgi:hypothetical protein